MPDDLESTSDVDDDADAEYREPAFLNVSITPVEVSVICPRRLTEKYFDPVIDQLRQIDAALCSRVDVSEHDYIAMQVLGQGLEAGKRVVELTSPLAMAGMCVYASALMLFYTPYLHEPLQNKPPNSHSPPAQSSSSQPTSPIISSSPSAANPS